MSQSWNLWLAYTPAAKHNASLINVLTPIIMASYTTGRYRADAYVINSIGEPASRGTPLLLDNGTTVTASPLLINRSSPQPGDYWVIQEDGRISIVAKSVFEARYRLLPR